MNAAGLPISVYGESVDRLRARDLVTPVERLRRETFALLDQIATARTEEEVEQALPTQRAALERPLGAALALLDHGGERGILEVAWTVQAFAAELGSSEGEPGEPMTAVALRDLAFSLLADCLARGRLDPLPGLAAVTIPSRYERQVWPLLEAAGVRYPDAFGRGADRAYLSWSGWLADSPLIAELSHVRSAESFKPAIAEAELIGALAFARARDERTFCGVIGAGGDAERRLRLQLRDPASAAALAAFFSPEGEASLAEELNSLYGRLGGPDGFGTRGQLIPTD
jgi:hypothetical protein